MDMDKEMERILSEKMEIPHSIVAKKEAALEEIKEYGNKEHRIRKNKKLITVMVSSIMALFVAAGCLFGKDVMAYLKSLMSTDIGIQKSIDQGNSQVVDDMVVKDKGVQVKLTNVLEVREVIYLTFNVKFDDKDIVKDLVVINGFLDVKGDNHEYIHMGRGICTNVNKDTGECIMDISLRKSLFYKDGAKMGPWGSYDNISEKFIKDGVLEFRIGEFLLGADINSKVEPDESVPAEMRKAGHSEGVKPYKIIKGNWNCKVKVDDKFKNTPIVEYKAMDLAMDEFKNIKVESTIMGTFVTVEYNEEKYNELSDKEIYEKMEHSRENLKIKIANGEIYRESKSTVLHMDTSIRFNVTSDECGDKLTLIIQDLNGKEYAIELTKNS